MRSLTTLIRRTVTLIAVTLTCVSPSLAQGQDGADAPPSPPKSHFMPRGFIAEPGAIERAVVFAERRQGNGEFAGGWLWGLADMVPGAGWLSGYVGYRRWGDKDRSVADLSTAVSIRGHKTFTARYELPQLARGRVAVGAQFGWQDFPHVTYFGEGSDSLETHISEYRLRSSNLVGYATIRPMRWLAIGTDVGVLKPSALPRGGAFLGDAGGAGVTFAGDPIPGLDTQPAYLTTQISITADTRDFPRHPLRGGIVHVAATRYSDRSDRAGAPSANFRRYEAEAAQFIPFADDRIVLAVHGRVVGSRTDEGQFVPFYLQPNLGGHTSLRSYADYRFHDHHLLGLNVETRVALMTHVDAAMFVDAGNVAARVADLNLAKRSYGAGLRLHSRRSTFARLDLAHGAEGWRLVLRLSDPLQLARLARRTAQIPFLP